MSEQIEILLSFVFAIAMTHLLSSATDLILARERVRFSGLHALWMCNALILLMQNWLNMASMHGVAHWSPPTVVLLFVTAVFQYFTCSTLAIRVPREGPVDMAAFFARQRPVIFGALAGLYVSAMIANYAFRGVDVAGPTGWILENSILLATTPLLVLGAWARPLWLQWSVALLVLAVEVYFLANFTMPI